jgi:hypothetical protein
VSLAFFKIPKLFIFFTDDKTKRMIDMVSKESIRGGCRGKWQRKEHSHFRSEFPDSGNAGQDTFHTKTASFFTYFVKNEVKNFKCK